jgi:hypothetical protein
MSAARAVRVRSPARWLTSIAALVLLALASAGCSGRDRGETAGASSVMAPPVDTRLMAYLSKARSVHHLADMREEDGDLRGAVSELDKLMTTPLPAGAQPMQEALEVLADTYARTAELRGQLGEFDAAERDLQQGLQRAPKVSFFEGHLYEVRGVIEQKRAKALADKGDKDGSEKQRRKAFEDFDQASRIQDKVIEHLLPDGGGLGR